MSSRGSFSIMSTAHPEDPDPERSEGEGDEGSLLNTSISVSLLKGLCRWRGSTERWFNERYKESQMSRLVQRLQGPIKVCFKYSFLGRVARIIEEENPAVLAHSKSALLVINSYKALDNRLACYSNISAVTNFIRGVRKEFYSAPIKTGSIIVVYAILINIALSFIFNNEISLSGWFIRMVFLFLGIGGLFCDAGWEDTKKTSFLRFFAK